MTAGNDLRRQGENMKRKIEFVIKTISIMLFVCSFAFLVLTKTNNNMGIRAFTVMSGSMEPTIQTGSLIVTKKQNSYSSSDIIAYQKNSVVVTHRLVDIQKNGKEILYKTKGDANKVADSEYIAAGSVLGKQILAIPYLGSVFSFVKSLPGFILLVLTPAILFIAFELAVILLEFEKRKMKYVMNSISTVYDRAVQEVIAIEKKFLA